MGQEMVAIQIVTLLILITMLRGFEVVFFTNEEIGAQWTKVTSLGLRRLSTVESVLMALVLTQIIIKEFTSTNLCKGFFSKLWK